MKEQQFFSKQPKQAGPRPFYVDHRKIPEDNTIAMNRALHQLSSTIETTHKIVKEYADNARSLPKQYKNRVEKEMSFLRKYLGGISDERPEEIIFILSIANSIQPSCSTRLNLKNLTQETKRLDKMAQCTPLIIHGAYLFVQNEIKASYQNAWFSKDPHSSKLFQELTHRLGEKSNDEKMACLTALQTHLQSKTIHDKILFGSKGVEKVLSQLNTQISSLESPSPAKAM